MHEDSEGLNLEQTLKSLRRRAPLILVCTVVAALAAFAFSRQETKKYTATASLAFNNDSLSQQIAGLSAASNSSQLAQQASDLELVRLGDMSAKTAAIVGRGLTQTSVADSISVASAGESSVVAVTATATSPLLAARIAHVYTRQFVSEQRAATRQYFRSALALVHKQLNALSPKQRIGPDGLALQNRAQSLGLLSELQYGNVQIAQEALPPSGPSSPRTSRDTLLGALLGLLVGVGIALVLERTDRRIRGPEDLEAIYSLPVLGVVPASAQLGRSQPGGEARAVLPAPEAQAFQLIRAHLRFFNVDRDIRTVLMVSPTLGDGTTTVARHLAEEAARMSSRVLLVEVNLRNPTLAGELGVEPEPGLTEVLTGTDSMDRATQSIRLAVPAGGGVRERTLDVLVAGSILPPNPGELTESQAMGDVLEQARSLYDLVVIDAPPLTLVSDAFPLLSRVDGVVVVGRPGYTRREAAERLHEVLSGGSAPLLGVIANGGKSGVPPAYGGGARRKAKSPARDSHSANGASPDQDASSDQEDYSPSLSTSP